MCYAFGFIMKNIFKSLNNIIVILSYLLITESQCASDITNCVSFKNYQIKKKIITLKNLIEKLISF